MIIAAKIVLMLCSNGGPCDCVDIRFEPDLSWEFRSCSVEPLPTPTPIPTPSPSPTATPTPTPEPPPTPTPSPTPSLCYSGPWTCGPHTSQPIKFWTDVENAVQETIDTDPRFSDGMSLPEHVWALWATEVMFRLEERGFCASKIGTDRGDTPSKEEVAVWSPDRLVDGELQREHWDLVVGTRDKIGKAYMFLPTVCVPKG